MFSKSFFLFNPWVSLWGASLVVQTVKNMPTMWETQVWSLGPEDPWRREWQPTPVFLPGELHEQRSLAGYSPRGCKRVRHGWATNTFSFPSVFVCQSCLNKAPQTELLKQQKFLFSQFWRLDISDQGVCRSGVPWGLSPWLADGYLLAVSSYIYIYIYFFFFSVHVNSWCLSVFL